MPSRFFRPLNLNVKLNTLLLVTFALLLITLVTVTNTGFTTLMNQVSTEQLAEEVATLQQHFADIEGEVFDSARLLSSAPGLVEAIEASDAAKVRTAILLQGESLALDDIDVVNNAGERLLTVSSADTTTANVAEDRLIGLALIGASTTGLVPKDDEILLSGFVPIKNPAGSIIGAVLAGRAIDESFMNTLNFERENPVTAFIYQDEVLAQSYAEEYEVENEFSELDQDQAYIDQALRGQVWISDGLVADENNTPDGLAYVPLIVGGEVQAVLAFRSEFETLLSFQGELTTRNLLVVGMISLISLLVTVFFIRRTVTLPLAHLKTVSEKISHGDFEQRAPVKSQDEIGQLAQSFNSMADQLNRSFDEIKASLAASIKSEEAAKRSDQVKSAFLASMSHELRTPLNSVINFTKFVAKGTMGPVNDEQKEALEEAIDSAKHLLSLINDVLDMSKIESGSLKLFVENNIDLKLILDTVMSTGRGLLVDKSIVLKAEIDPTLPRIRCDRQRILQILLNVMSNACKFTEKGSIILRAGQVNGEIRFAVEDTGAGIAPEDVGDVFEPFRQTETGLRQAGGTGLGMPISKSLVEAHGGRIWLESIPGQGTTFTVAIPLHEPVINEEDTLTMEPVS
jgi:signal transduction histidine kinase